MPEAPVIKTDLLVTLVQSGVFSKTRSTSDK